jgi:hypothetical protein
MEQGLSDLGGPSARERSLAAAFLTVQESKPHLERAVALLKSVPEVDAESVSRAEKALGAVLRLEWHLNQCYRLSEPTDIPPVLQEPPG